MGNKLYVGNLPFSVTEDSLQQLFSQSGKVESATIITDRDTGRSKGFGFVEMTKPVQRPRAKAEVVGVDSAEAEEAAAVIVAAEVVVAINAGKEKN